ncbi:MAG: tetratricopeptide repeat protein [Proteobacteria bacterium]|nr:tetratricopeptide repeat protein [Pseudomonadota bacterium]
MDDAVSGPWLLDPETRLQLRLKGLRTSLAQGDFEEAILEAEELLDEEPDYADGLYLLGEALLDANDPEGAVMAFQRHVQLVGDDLESLLRLGLARFEICDLEGAEEVVREVARRRPEDALAHYQLSLILEAQDRRTESVGALMMANRLDPHSFPLPNHWTDAQWSSAIEEAIQGLAPLLRKFWAGIPMRVEPAPFLDELKAEDPPLSPRISGIVLGTPAEAPDPQGRPEAMRFFQRNLDKAATYEEFVEWVGAALEREACEWLGLDPDRLDDAP